MDEYYGKPLAEDEAEKTIETNRALARWLDSVRHKQKDFSEHSIMEQLRKIRFPTWLRGNDK